MVAQDTLEFVAGSKVQGKLVELQEDEGKVRFEVTVGGRKLTRTFPLSKVRAVTTNGERRVLNAAQASSKATLVRPSRTRAQVEQLIDQQGSTLPDWFDSTPLEYPPTLDLDWPLKPDGAWDNQRNVGQYIWDIVNPNPGRWRGGVKLMYHVMSRQQNEPALHRRDMRDLGGMYFRFFQDYSRAAYWWRKAGVAAGDPDSIALAECYWRLGSKQMAAALLNTPTLRPAMVKLWGEMGDTRQALQIANRLAPALTKRDFSAAEVYLYAGDVLRATGNHKQAVRFYQRVLDEPEGLKGRGELNRNRAQANMDAIELYELLDVAKVPDGTYSDQSVGYSGPVHVDVTVAQGRITDVTVTRHEERQFYAALTDTSQQIIKKQTVRGIDATSRATVTSEAIVNATAKALAKVSAKKK
jgi:uncharacterized protein with FMN-binding domain